MTKPISEIAEALEAARKDCLESDERNNRLHIDYENAVQRECELYAQVEQLKATHKEYMDATDSWIACGDNDDPSKGKCGTCRACLLGKVEQLAASIRPANRCRNFCCGNTVERDNTTFYCPNCYDEKEQEIASLKLRAEAAEKESGRLRKANGRLSEVAIDMPDGISIGTEVLVRDFASALAEKLFDAEMKYGYSDGWSQPDWMDECRQKLVDHLEKGDPRDVAAYCAFLWYHKEKTSLGSALIQAKQQAGAAAERNIRLSVIAGILDAITPMFQEPAWHPYYRTAAAEIFNEIEKIRDASLPPTDAAAENAGEEGKEGTDEDLQKL